MLVVFYNWLASGSTESTTSKLELWKVGLSEGISEDEWRQVCKNAQKQLGNVSLKLLQYNWLMQTYITPVKLNRFNENIPDTYFKCREAQGSFVHCVWECSRIICALCLGMQHH